MKGVHAQVAKLFTRSSENYIITSRVIQGQRDLRGSTLEERNDIVARWNSGTFDLKSFNKYKKKERASQKAPAPPLDASDAAETSTGPQPGWLTHRLSSFDERIRDEKTRFHARKDSWQKNFRGASGTSASGSSSMHSAIPEDAEFEQAIQASVRETSRGNAEEDAAVEAAIRQSVNAVRQQGQLPEPVPTVSEKDPSIFKDKEYQITDEEYQDLIEQAIRESMASQSGYASLPQEQGIMELDATEPTAAPGQSQPDQDHDADLQRAIEESKKAPEVPSRPPNEEEELQRAIEVSREEAKKEKSQRTEEDIVMEYVKKQSLAEEEFRNQRNKGKGEESYGENDDHDEDLKRAMEESLKMSRADESGPSAASG